MQERNAGNNGCKRLIARYNGEMAEWLKALV